MLNIQCFFNPLFNISMKKITIFKVFFSFLSNKFRMSNVSGHQTLGRLPSHSAHSSANGKYATLSKQCKTLESNDFY